MVVVPSEPDQIEREVQLRRDEPEQFRPSTIFWRNGTTIRVGFLDGPKKEQDNVFGIAEEWTRYANLTFVRAAANEADVRVSFQTQGEWSYMGTQCRSIPKTQPTTSLGALNSLADEQQVRRTVLHVFGHVLGLSHEHQTPAAKEMIDLQKAYKYFGGPPMFWNKDTVDRNLATVKSVDPVYAKKPFDPNSVMLYSLPAEIMVSGWPAEAGAKLSSGDITLIRRIYPGR
jgi:hypothetical protein